MTGTSPGMTGYFLRAELVRKSGIVPQTSQSSQQVSHRQGCHLRAAARVRHQEGIRQSRLDRAAVPERLARRHRLRAGPAGSHRHRHGRRLRAGDPQRRLRQPAFGGRRRQRARQYLHRAPQPDTAGDHGGAAGTLDPAAAGVPPGRTRLGIPPPLCQIQRRAGARRRRASGNRTRLLRGDAAALRSDVCIRADRRLDAADASHRGPQRQP